MGDRPPSRVPPPEQADLAVVGASPAGLSAAHAAAIEGLDVVLLEAARVGDPEPPAVVGFDHAWPPTIQAPAHTRRSRFEQVRLASPAGHAIAVDAPGRIVDRKRFDRWLAKRARKAGAQVFSEVGSCSVRSPGRLSHPEGALEADVVVFADGARSIAAELVDPVVEPDRLVWGVTHEVPVDDLPQALEVTVGSHAPGGRTQVLPVDASTVWHWTFAQRSRDEVVELADQALEAAIERHGWPDRLLDEAVRRHVAPDPVFQRPGTLAADRTLVAGGAGGLGGLEAGLASGRLAGLTAARAIEQGRVDREALAGYEQACRDRFVPAYEGLAQLMRVAQRTPDEVLDALVKPWAGQQVDLERVAGLGLADPSSRLRTLAGLLELWPTRTAGSLAGAAVAAWAAIS